MWVIHDVTDPDQLLREAARVIHAGGTLIVSDIQIHDREDPIGRILGELTDRLHAHHAGVQPRGLRGAEIVDRATPHGFVGQVVQRAWPSHPGYEFDSIRNTALEALPKGDTIQRAWTEFAVMTRKSE